MAIVFIQSSNLKAVEKEQINAMIDRHIDDIAIPGIAVGIIKDDKEVYYDTKGVNGQGNKLNSKTPMFIGSVSKSLTALAVMQLVEDNLISLDEPVKKYITYFEVSDPKLSEEITVRDVLNQTTGLARKNSIPSSDYDFTLKERVKELADMRASRNRGEFNYLNDHYNILGLLIEEVTGSSYAEYMEENVFKPIGMINTTADIQTIRDKDVYGYTNIFGFSKSIKQSVPRYDIPSGYILSNLEDMYRYLEFLIDPDKSIISKESIDIMRTTAGNSTYGMGWHIRKIDGQRVVEHSGAVPGFSSHLAVIPATNSGYLYIMNKNHLIHNFVNVYNRINGNMLKAALGDSSFNYFPSIWVIRIFSLVLLILTAKDLWNTKELFHKTKDKKGWVKEAIKSLLLILFLTLGLSFILRNMLGLAVDLKIMFAYVPDYTALLVIDILVQVIRLAISLFYIFKTKEKHAFQE
ncbi:MAG TPA: serine hydrolase domain-containing protein [Halanaerobiales bacterium]|nr:serine hydrolase domain-containing protein [Halanaerobiales bacterium]